MKCPSCSDTKMIVYNKYYRAIFQEGEWVNITPLSPLLKISEFKLKCLSCEVSFTFDLDTTSYFYQKWNKIEFSPKIYPITQKRVCLDLDSTLVYAENTLYVSKDLFEDSFLINLGEGHSYKIIKRPFVDKLLDFLNKNFEEVIILTAASKTYAQAVSSNLGLVNSRILSKEDFKLESTEFESSPQVMKKINDSIVIDDKVFIIDGKNNIILGVKPFLGEKDDKELLDVLSYFEKFISIPQKCKKSK